ncbi:hypothetical protein PUNSTDRAFT_53202, partial [Punctularia strigosozonata HHB-11173 SS5]|uniref:uncharacterized protein n=1 Tax=Punctularia strigosozonata (strain HHB-11173) TaxID=741275 RepID=UPI0004417A12
MEVITVSTVRRSPYPGTLACPRHSPSFERLVSRLLDNPYVRLGPFHPRRGKNPGVKTQILPSSRVHGRVVSCTGFASRTGVCVLHLSVRTFPRCSLVFREVSRGQCVNLLNGEGNQASQQSSSGSRDGRDLSGSSLYALQDAQGRRANKLHTLDEPPRARRPRGRL